MNAAAASNCIECLELVLAQTPPKGAINNAFLAASLMSTTEILKMLLTAGADPNAAKDKAGKTALMEAVYSDFAEPSRIQLLLEHGADINAKSKSGDTALREARKKGETKIVQMLIAAGGQEDLADKK